MRIGLTYDLRSEYLAAGYGEEETAEFDRPDTIDAIESAVQSLGHATDRIGNIWRLVERLAAGDRWDLVFNIAEGLRGLGREAQVPAVLDAYGIPYTFSDPLVMALSLHKGHTKAVVRAAGAPTPDFLVVESQADLAPGGRLERAPLSFPVFAKPIAEGTGKGITAASKITSFEALKSACADLLARYKQPVLVETYLSGREFTVGLAGTGEKARVLGTLEITLLEGAEADAYSYVNKERCEELVNYQLVRPADESVRMAEETALLAWRALDCRDAGRVDLRCDERGAPQFIEVNPLSGLHPAHSDLPMLCTQLGIPYVELIRMILESASERVSL
jgi:D-alanine-D-alanine ligase